MTCSIFAHRGYSANYPENTMLAFIKAYEAGCDGIELDVQQTRDEILVIIHDESIKRTCGKSGMVKDLTYEQLCQYDFSYTFPQYGFQKIPTFEEYCKWASSLDIVTNIELKTSIVRYEGIEEQVYALICKYGLQNRVIISSFNHESILRMKELDSKLVCGFLTDCCLLEAGKYTSSHGVEGYHPRFQTLSSASIAELKAHQVRILCWTVNRKKDKQKMMEAGVDAIITNVLE